MTLYFFVKLLHILSSVLLVGTGFGSAFYLYFTHRTRNVAAIAEVSKLVVRADWWFTLPTVIVQPVTGFIMLTIAGYDATQFWLICTYVLYVFSGLCWLPVVWLQIQMARIANTAALQNTDLSEQYWRYAKYWEWLGYPAFFAMLVIYALMVYKPNTI